MHFREMDMRIGPLDYVIVGIDAGLAAIQARMEEVEWYDGLHAREDAEPLLGLGFVAFQTYATGAVSDLNQIRRDRGKPELTDHDCYACDAVRVAGVATRLQLIHSAANYFKHHDQWPNPWPTVKHPAARAVNVLGLFGITQRTEFPCIKTVEILCGTSWKLIVLHQMVGEWRAHLFSTLQ